MSRVLPIKGLDERRLRRRLALLFLALAVPAVILVWQAYSRLNWEAFRLAQVLAEELVARIDDDLAAGLRLEEARSFGEYAFLVVEGDPAARFVQRSPLSAFPVESAIPGVLGYFQVNADGALSTPLLPQPGVDAEPYGISSGERLRRLAHEQRIREVLVENRLVHGRDRDDAVAGSAAPAPALAGKSLQAQAAFDALERSANAGAGQRADAQVRAESARRQQRAERISVPESPPAAAAESAAGADLVREFRISTFESEIDPFEFGLLDTGHIVMFRKVWRESERLIQGAVIESGPFIAGAIDRLFRASSLADTSELVVAYQRSALARLSYRNGDPGFAVKPGANGALLYQARLSPPLGDLELMFHLHELPHGPGSLLLGWVTLALSVVLLGGFLLMYRFALGQIRLARQQQDFVSAVSHELKTPLTSIRMYSEMLQAGWTDESKRQTYYDYIHAESERLSRLIENVLQLARMTRNELRLDLKPVPVAELMDIVGSRVGSLAERAGFELLMPGDAAADPGVVRVDADCFTQIIINLVDNAIKFSAGATRKAIEIRSRRESDGAVIFTVRDFGPGVPKAQMKKIFELFYRADNALSRETVGTGIGLALVRQLATAMGAQVDVRNREPGAEFSIAFPGDLR